MYRTENKWELDTQKLQEDLERQYGVGVAQDIIYRTARTGTRAKAPDYMDVKTMSELAERFRAQAMMAVWRLKTWRKGQIKIMPHDNLIQLEGVFLERQCEDAVKLYRLANKTYFSMYREAMTDAMIGQETLYIPLEKRG